MYGMEGHLFTVISILWVVCCGGISSRRGRVAHLRATDDKALLIQRFFPQFLMFPDNPLIYLFIYSFLAPSYLCPSVITPESISAFTVRSLPSIPVKRRCHPLSFWACGLLILILSPSGLLTPQWSLRLLWNSRAYNRGNCWPLRAYRPPWLILFRRTCAVVPTFGFEILVHPFPLQSNSA